MHSKLMGHSEQWKDILVHGTAAELISFMYVASSAMFRITEIRHSQGTQKKELPNSY